MITTTRRQAKQMHVVFRRALNLTRGPGPALFFETGPDGICVKARSGDAAVEYHLLGKLPHQQMWVPFEFLTEVEGRQDDPVQLEVLGDGQVIAGWRCGGVPQIAQYDPVAATDTDDFPEKPKKFAENPTRLLTALHDAMQTTDPESCRYALSCVQLRGTDGDMAATDGRQLLIQNGFKFPWQDDVLIPRTKVFGRKELARIESTAIGKTDDWVVVRAGPWSFYLKIEKDKLFPEVRNHVPSVDAATAGFRISPKDAPFLTKSLPRLPGDKEFNLPITVDLNGTVAIRAKSASRPKPTELILANSTPIGEPMRINMNRQYLARAVKLGFDEVQLYNPKVPVSCRDEYRSYVWALLSPTSAIPPADDVIRVESPKVGVTVCATD